MKTILSRTGDTIAYAEFVAGMSKGVVDQIDSVLTTHYGFSVDGSDIIMNYDIKYRMGGGSNNGSVTTTCRRFP